MKNITTSIILERRTPTKDNTYPVKLRLTIGRKSRYYGLGHYLSPEDFEKILSPKPRMPYKSLKAEIFAELHRSRKILEEMKQVSFERFKVLFTTKTTGDSVFQYYEITIAEFNKNQKYGTANTYHFAMKSFKDVKNISSLKFSDITPYWLQGYENKMRAKGKSFNTIAMNLRTLRAQFNRAINDGIVSPEIYPFGNRKNGKYAIPESENNKRPLDRTEIQKLSEYVGNPINEYYRDFFLLSYYLVGLNFMDLLTLRWSDIDGDTIKIIRTKTESSSAKKSKVTLYISRQARALIDKHGNGKPYVFNIVSEKSTPSEIRQKIKNFNRNTNQALKKIAKKLSINRNISVIYARHSAASHAAASNISLADISQALGHKNIKTTSHYLSSLDEGIKALGESLEINPILTNIIANP